jgi:hypothetical protein
MSEFEGAVVRGMSEVAGAVGAELRSFDLGLVRGLR